MLLFIPRSLCALKRVAAKYEHARFGATQGIRIALAAGVYRAEATDGRRAMIVQGLIPGEDPPWPGFKDLPDDACEAIILPRDLERACKVGEDFLQSRFGLFGIATMGNDVCLGLGSELVTARTVEGKFPNINQVIPRKKPLFTFSFDPKTLAETLLAMSGAGSTNALGTLQLGEDDGSSHVETLVTRGFVNAGSAIWVGAGSISQQSSSVFSNTGTLNIENDLSWANSSGATLSNSGTLEKSGGIGTTTLAVLVSNSGTLSVSSGILDLTGAGGTDAGTYTPASGGTLAFAGTGTTTLSASSSVSGSGTFEIAGGTIQVAGTYNVTGVTSVGGGTLVFESGAQVQAMGIVPNIGSITHSPNTDSWVGSTLGGAWSTAGNWSAGVPDSSDFVSISATYSGATITVSSGTAYAYTLVSSATIDVTGGTLAVEGGQATNLIVAGGTFLDNLGISVSGQLTWTGGSMTGAGVDRVAGTLYLGQSGASSDNETLSTGTLYLQSFGTGYWLGGGSFTQQNGSMFLNQGTFFIQNNLTWSADPASLIDNMGTITKNTASLVTTLSATLENTGTLDVASGTITLAGGGMSSGTLTAGTSGSLDFGGQAVMTMLPGSIVGGGGSVEFGSQVTVYEGGTYGLSSAHTQVDSGATLQKTSAATDNSGDFSANSSLVIYTGTSGSSWGSAGNWSNSSVPGSANNTEQVVVPLFGAGASISFSGGATDTISSLLSPATLALSGGSLSITTFNSPGLVSLSGGTLAVTNLTSAGVTMATGTLTLGGASTITNLSESGGTLNGAGTLSVTGQLSWVGGTMSGSGSTSALGTLILGNEDNNTLSQTLATRSFVNSGSASWIGTGTFSQLGGSNFTNSGTLTIDNDVPWANTSGTNTFTNSGTLLKSAGVGTTTLAVLLNNSGTVSVQAGTLALTGTGSDSGTFTVGSGETLNFDATGTTTLTSSSTITGTGTVAFSAGTVNESGTYNNTVTSVVNGGTVNFSGGFQIQPVATLSTSGSPSTYGQSVTLTATVADTSPYSGTPTGTVTFYNGGTSLGTGTLGVVSGHNIATLVTSTLSVGNHPSISAVYGGNATYLSSTALAIDESINPANSTTALTSSTNAPVYGQSVTFTATVTPGTSGTPTGTVTFYDGATSLGTGTLALVGVNDIATLTTTALPLGTDSPVSAVYAGDGTFSSSTSSALTEAVSQDSSTTAVTSPANPGQWGQTITFTAAVSAGSPGSGTPTGTVQFAIDGTNYLSPVTLSGGQATITDSSLSIANHTITASYSGDTDFTASNDTGSPLIETITTDNSTTTLMSTLNPSTYDQSVTLIAQVSASLGGTPTGTVTFYDGATSLGTGTLVSGGGYDSTALSTSSLPAGNQTITAVYAGDSDFSSSTSSPLTQIVDQQTTTTSIGPSSDPAVYGQTVTFTAGVTGTIGGTPTGTVTFYEGATSLGTGTLIVVGGHALTTLATSGYAVGSYSPISAVYGGDGNFLTSTSSGMTETITQDGSTTAVASSSTLGVWGQTITFTATVSANSPGAGTPTGTVQFYVDSIAYLSPVRLSSGQATITDASLSVGNHTITAIYAGDTNFTSSNDGSSPLTETITQDGSTTAVTSASNPGVWGQTITFTAAVSSNSPGSGTPTGTVQFAIDGSDYESPVTLSGGLATITDSSLSIANHTITASYDGDTDFTASNDNGSPLTQAIDKAGTATTVTSAPNPAVYGQSVALTATVSASSPGSGTPTGTVTFYDGSTSLGTGTLAVAGGHDQATLSTSSLPVGGDLITVVYAGDAYFTTSTSSALTETINQAGTATTIASSTNAAVYSQSVTFTATISPSSPGAGTPTGTVTFYDGGSSFGTATLAVSGSYDVATVTTSGLSVGTHSSITAVYAGDTNFSTSTSAPLTETVSQAGTATAVSSSENPAAYGDTVTFTATVSPAYSGTPTGTVTFYDSSSTLGTGTLTGGVATYSTSTLSVGDHPSISAAYSGDANFTSSTSAPLDQVVKYVTTTTISDSPNLAIVGQPVTLTATEAVSSPGSGTPTGNVTFYDGSTSLGTGALAVVGSVDVASITLSTLTAGDHPSLNATYAGAANFFSSTSANLDLSVATVTWTSSPVSTVTISSISIQTSTEGTSASLSVAASDSGSYTMTYAAINLPAGLSINSTTGQITGTIAYGAAATFSGVYSPTVIVVDGEGGTASATFTWNVNWTTVTPSVTAPSSQTNTVGDTITPLSITASFVDPVSLTYTATHLPGGLSISSSTGVISGTIAGDAARSKIYAVTVTVIAWKGNSTSQTFNWTINDADLTPQVANPGNQANVAGDLVALPIGASAPDGGALSFQAVGLPTGLTIDPVSGVISGTIASTANTGSPYLVTVLVTNGTYSASQTFAWTVAAQNPITILNPGPIFDVNGDSVTLPIFAADATTSATLSYSLSGAPSGSLSISSSGQITGNIASTADTSSPYMVTVTAYDGTYSASTSFKWFVAHVGLTNPGGQENIEGQSVTLQLAGYNGDGGSMTYSVTGLPSGVTGNSSGLISGTLNPATASVNPYAVTATVTEGTFTATSSFAWLVTPQVDLKALPSQINAAGDRVALVESAADNLGLPVTYSAIGLPSGLSIDPKTGLIYGTIDEADSEVTPYSVTLKAASGSYSGSQTISWTVMPLYVQPAKLQNNNVGDSVSFQVVVSDNTEAGPLDYRASGLPAGLNIDPNTGIISGIVGPGADADSPYLVTVAADDGTHSDTQSFVWNVGALSLTKPSNQTSTEGGSVSLQLAASDRTGSVLYNAVDLPTGMSLNVNTGLISGTLAVGSGSSSPYVVLVGALDSNGNSVSQTFQWTVNSVVTLTNPGSKSNVAGDTVSGSLTATDSRGGATLTFSQTGLPSGLSLSGSTGAFSGTVTSGIADAGPFNVTVSATDGTYSATQTFAWSMGELLLTDPGTQMSVDGATISLATSVSSNIGGMTYIESGLPSGFSISSGGVISGTFSSTADTSSPYKVTVTATDSSSHSASQMFKWFVSPLSLATVSNQTSYDGVSASLALSGSGPSGDTLTYSATGLPLGLYLSPSTGNISGNIAPEADLYSPYAVTVNVFDKAGYVATQNFGWTISPQVSLATAGSQTLAEGQTTSLSLAVSDHAGGSLTATVTGLPSGMSSGLSGSTLSFSGSPNANTAGNYKVGVFVGDGTYSAEEIFNLKVTPRVSIGAPPPQFNAVGASVSLAIAATASDSGSLSYSMSGQPSGLSINSSTGVITGTATTATTGWQQVTVSVADGGTTDKMTFFWRVGSLALKNPGPQVNDAGISISPLTITTSGTTTGSLTWALSGLPSSSLSISSGGVISGSFSNPGSYTAVVNLTTGGGQSASQAFSWTVLGAVYLGNPGNQINTAGDAVYLPLAGMDPAGESLTYAVAGGALPPDLTLNTSTGLISGNLTSSDVSSTPYGVTISATDTDGRSATQSFAWTVNGVTLANPGNLLGVQGQTVSLQMQALGESLAFSGSGSLPAGLTLESSGLITGTPTTVGQTSVTIEAYDDLDSSLNASQTFTWTILPDVTLAFISNQTSVDGDAVTLPVSASSAATSPSLSYTVSGLPSGFSISSSGVLTGTWGSSADVSSPYTATLTVADTVGGNVYSASQNFTWTVTPVGLVNLGLQANAAGTTIVPFYASGRAASGGDTLSYSLSGQPSGITINSGTGQISGTIGNSASTSSPYTVIVTLNDTTLDLTTNQSFAWIVAPRLSLFNPGSLANSDGDKVSMQMQSVDAASSSLTYSASGLPSTLSMSSTGLLSGTLAPSADTDSPYSVTVTVNDGTVTTSQTFSWAITKPTLSLLAPGNQTNVAGSAVKLFAFGSASNGDTISYSQTGLPSGLSIGSSSGAITGTISTSAAASSPYTVTIIATDTANTSITTSQTFAWAVNPVLTLSSPGPQTTSVGAAFSLSLAAQSTVSGTSITYGATGLPTGYTLGSGTNVISGTGNSSDVGQGTYLVTITATQGSVTASQVFAWTVTPVTLQNPGPQFNNAGDFVLLSLAASDTDSGVISYTVTGLPSGLYYVSSDGLVYGAISSSAAQAKPYSVTVTAWDGSASQSQQFNWYVASAPQITVVGPGNQRNLTGDFVLTGASASDPFGGVVTYSQTGLPGGLLINPTTGLITGTIGSGDTTDSPYAVTVTGADGGHSGSTTFTWKVSAPSLSFANPGPLTSPVGLPVSSFTFQASVSATWSQTGLPSGLSLSSGGVLTGTPTTAGNYLVNLSAASGGTTVSRSFDWQITAAGVAFPGNQTSTEGQTVKVQLEGVGGAGLTYAAIGLPNGVTVNQQTGLISGTIAANTAGLYIVDVAAGIGTNSGTSSFTWIVNPKISLTAVPDQTSTEGQAAAIQIVASGSTGLTYTARGLPTGVTIGSSSGLISGNPAAGTAIKGGYLVTVTVSDGTYRNSLSFAWLVNPASTPAAPVVAKVPNQSSTAGQSVLLNLNTFDPAGYGYIEDVKNLPDGLVLDPLTGAIDGVIADDAASPVPYRVSVTVNDGLNTPQMVRFLWSVDPAPVTAQVYPIAATMGTPTGQVNIAGFTTPDLNSLPGDFIVTINWGDGESSIGNVTGGFGSFTITANHTFADSGSLPISVDIWNVYGAVKETYAYGTSVVTTSLTGGFQLGALAGTSTPLTLAYFNAGFGGGSPLIATIDWGDGSTPTTATISSAGAGLYQIAGSHVYAAIGQFTATITVKDQYGVAQTTTSTVEVGNLYAGVNGVLTLATFQGLVGASYTVAINWGDGDTGSGTTTVNGTGQVTITGNHVFAVDSIDNTGGVYQVALTITSAGSSWSTTIPVEVTRPKSTLIVANLPAKSGTVLSSQVVALFVETDDADATTEFSAGINWGDGNTGSGTVTEIGTGTGLFEVTGSHTYSANPTGALLINVSQDWSTPLAMLAQAAKLFTGDVVVVDGQSYDLNIVKGNNYIGITVGNQVTKLYWFHEYGTTQSIYRQHIKTYGLQPINASEASSSDDWVRRAMKKQGSGARRISPSADAWEQLIGSNEFFDGPDMSRVKELNAARRDLIDFRPPAKAVVPADYGFKPYPITAVKEPDLSANARFHSMLPIGKEQATLSDAKWIRDQEEAAHKKYLKELWEHEDALTHAGWNSAMQKQAERDQITYEIMFVIVPVVKPGTNAIVSFGKGKVGEGFANLGFAGVDVVFVAVPVARAAGVGAGGAVRAGAHAPLSTTSVVTRYGSAEQRQFLLNAVNETASLREGMGVVHSFQEMRRLGYQLENVALHYRGHQGVDLIFSRGGVFAVVEAKAGGSLSSLRTYAGGLRQGSNPYNIDRLRRYLRFGDGTHDEFVNRLLSEAAAGRLESFAAFYRSGRLYELPLTWPTVPAIAR